MTLTGPRPLSKGFFVPGDRRFSAAPAAAGLPLFPSFAAALPALRCGRSAPAPDPPPPPQRGPPVTGNGRPPPRRTPSPGAAAGGSSLTLRRTRSRNARGPTGPPRAPPHRFPRRRPGSAARAPGNGRNGHNGRLAHPPPRALT